MNPVLACIKAYQWLTKWLRAAQVPGIVYTPCKFYPSCSEYAELAVRKHGTVKGSLKALVRIIRCNPFSSGGVDFP